MVAAGRVARALLVLALPALAATTFHRQWHWYKADDGRSAAQLNDSGYITSGVVQESSGLYGVVLARIDHLGDTTSVQRFLNLDSIGGFSCRLPDGGYALLAESATKILVRRYGAAGDSAWEYRSAWGGPISALMPTFDGGCLVAGRIPDTAYSMGAIKLAADGHEEWRHCYYDPTVSASSAYGASQTRDSGYILCGDANDYMGSYLRLVRLTPGGDTVWARIYAGTVGPMLSDVREMSDSGFLAVGYVFDTSGRNAFYMMRTAGAGDTVWTRRLAPAGAAAQAAAMCATSDGGFAVIGVADWGDSARAWLVKTNALGDTVWTAVLPGSGHEVGNDVEQTADGGYVIAGTSDAGGGSMLLIKTDSLGYVAYGIAEDKPLAVSGRIVLSVEPNPASSLVRIACSLPGNDASRITLTMYDALGRKVFASSGLRSSVSGSRTSSFVLRTSSFPPGVYLLRLASGGSSAVRKLVLQ